MADPKFEYDMDAQLNEIMDGKKPGAGAVKAGAAKTGGIGGGKVEPWNDVPEP